MALATFQPPCALLLRPRTTRTRAAPRPATARPARVAPAHAQPTLRSRRGAVARAAGDSGDAVSTVLAEVTDTSRLGARGEWLCVPLHSLRFPIASP